MGTGLYRWNGDRLRPGACPRFSFQNGAFPVSERAAEEVLSLPIYAELTEEQQAYVVETIKDFYSRN
ncbi:MAG: DegT/DnrJ/EryC1/StrS family aminotransferase [Nitrospiraceae bacterium]